ncbi:hypothetical protein BV25DRAFT_1790558, partial [Artomyces pyxidatus]
DSSSDDNTITPTIIAGIAVAGCVLAAVALWLGIRAYRKRATRKREEARNAAFLTVKGIVKEGDIEKDAPPSPGSQPEFVRPAAMSSIVMPNKAIVRPSATKEEIIQYHKETGTLTHKFSLAPPGAVPRPSLTIPGTEHVARPHSTISFVSPTSPNKRSSFFSFNRMSTASTFSNSSSVHGVEGRKVRQLFAPVLPDELVLSLGEKITVVQSYDDGWCIVGRDSMLKSGDVEMGAVPAWVFMKPVKGLRAERPMRTTSLGVTVEMDAGPAREQLVSWSNF